MKAGQNNKYHIKEPEDHFDSKCAFYLYLCTLCHYVFQISRANIVFVPAKVDTQAESEARPLHTV